MFYPVGEPVVRSTASVLTTDITVTFREKTQCNRIMEYLVSKEYNFTFDKYLDANGNHYIYTLSIYTIPWAYNVEELFKILKEYDYNDGCYVEEK